MPFGMATRFELQQESELRVEAGWDSEIYLQLVSGNAEIFGTELPSRRWLKFPPGHKFAVFTWSAATVVIDGTTEVAYLADETPMARYLGVHSMLESRRAWARDAGSSSTATSVASTQPEGPRVIVVGPTDSGKSSLTKMLLGWATRQGWKPTFVDLDLGQGSLTIPGTLAATPVDVPVDPVEGIPLEAPLVYFYGHSTPSVNPDLYRSLVKELARASAAQSAGNPETCAAGMVINTMGWVEGLGYELLLHAIESFSADVVLVLGQENLYSILQDKFGAKPGMDIVNLSKSGGVVARSQKLRQWTRNSRTREYFYGLFNELLPHPASVNFSEVYVFCIGGPLTSRSVPPVGVNPTSAVPVTITQDFVHSVLAVSFAKKPEQLLSSNVAGFIYISDVDLSRKRLSYVAPCPGPLPSNLLLIGSLFWVD